MAAMQDIEYAVREDERPRERLQPCRKFGGPADLALERRSVHRLRVAARGRTDQSMYSNRRTTFCTPLVVRAIWVALSASDFFTSPIR